MEKNIDFKKTKGKNASACLKEQKEETHEPPSSEIGEGEVVHEEDRKSLPSDSKKYEEISHEYEEVSIENMEDHFETHSTLEMKQRASTDGCLNYEGVPTVGCSHLVVVEEETRSTSPSPLELHEVGPRKKMKMRMLICKSLIFLKGP